jgi:hypothetical protein
VKTIAAIIIAGALSTLPGAGRADPVKTDKEQQARPATAAPPASLVRGPRAGGAARSRRR